MEKKKEKKGFIITLGDFITNKRYILLGIFLLLTIFCTFNINKVKINDSIVSYLPDTTETKQGLDLMEEEFGNLTNIKLMVNDISATEAQNLKEELSKIKHVENITFEKNENYYKDNNALFSIELEETNDEELNNTKEDIENLVKDSTYNIYSEEFEDPTDGIDIVLFIAIIVIIIILLITSKTYFEPVIAFIIFGISIILNMGSNFILGEISYITEAIAVILQLALSIDYVIIFMNQYMKEINDTDDTILAIKKTVSKSIKEIFASSLTTISGLLALIFMQLRIGGDIGIVLSKGILCSFITVILVMPSLLSIFHKYIIKFKKKEKEQKGTKISDTIFKTRKVLLPLFALLIIFSLFMIPKYNYVYDTTSTKSISLSTNGQSLKNIEEVFGSNNTLVILLKNSEKDYTKELELTKELSTIDNITSITSLGSINIADNIYLGTEINYLELSQLFNIDNKTTLSLYKLYAKSNNELDKLTDINNYKVSIINWIYFLDSNKETLPLPENISTQINYYITELNESSSLLESTNFSRIIINLNLPIEGDNTNETISKIRETSNKYYDNVMLVGNSINAIDLKDSFTHDNLIITFVTILFIIIILLFTFKSLPITLLLVLAIEGSILINFAIITLLDKEIFFMSYIVVSAIQMGATIDYAIVIASRYKQLRTKQDKTEAIINALNDSLPAVITSGLILLIAGFLIGFISKSSVISTIGLFLGIGTLISLLITIFILPGLLHLLDKILIKQKV